MKTQIVVTRYENRKLYSEFHKKFLSRKEIIEVVEDDSVDLVIKNKQGEDITLSMLKGMLPELSFTLDDVLDLIRRKGMGL